MPDQILRDVKKGLKFLKKHLEIVYIVLFLIVVGVIYQILASSLILGAISVFLGVLVFFGTLRAFNRITKKEFILILKILIIAFVIVAFAIGLYLPDLMI